jgi:hypothetical protein
MGFVKDSDILDVTKLREGPDDGGLEGDVYIEDDWEAAYDCSIPILIE